MALAAGTFLGPYEILAPLGAGGMGEVYRAKDTKLGREVALKILPASFTNDPERIARFRREAQVLAWLNHPHIAQIYGLEESNGTQFLTHTALLSCYRVSWAKNCPSMSQADLIHVRSYR